jgi:hypothetical protein
LKLLDQTWSKEYENVNMCHGELNNYIRHK